ncbi:hypothetical protein Godav_013584 [Gossypium davidsonii]|uniref:DUF4283 domain-containing protein n=1 Tax=Gossypium davidsonii TaxID=34287 RepID=A0A7J8RGZ7_GOSDV|nr:hypothetical protein [Gossypium davidsonii]
MDMSTALWWGFRLCLCMDFKICTVVVYVLADAEPKLYWWLSRKVSRAWPDLRVRFVLLCAFIAVLGYGGGHKCAAEKIKFFRRRRNYVPGLKISMVQKEEVSFVALTEGVILVKFGAIDDRTRILNLSPWLFDWCLFALLPFAIGEVLAIDWCDRDGVIKNDVDECGSGP